MSANETKPANKLTANADATQQIVPHKSASWFSVFRLSGNALSAEEEVASPYKQVVMASHRAEGKQRREWCPSKRLNLLRRQLFCGLISGEETATSERQNSEGHQQRASLGRKHLLSKRGQEVAPTRTSGSRKLDHADENCNNKSLTARCCLTLGSRKAQQQQHRFNFLSPKLEAKRHHSLSPNGKTFNNLIRMIVDKNNEPEAKPMRLRRPMGDGSSAAPTSLDDESQADPNRPPTDTDRSVELSRDILILLGSLQCPSGQWEQCQQHPHIQSGTQPHQQLRQFEASERAKGVERDNAQEPPAKASTSAVPIVNAASQQQQQQLRVNIQKQSRARAGPQMVDRMGQLIGLLDQYAKQIEPSQQQQQQQSSVIDRTGSPSTTSPSAGNRCTELSERLSHHQQRPSNEEDSMFQLEESWASFVKFEQQAGRDDGPAEELQRQRRANLKIQQDAIWELLTTEAFYIKRLKVIIDLFLATLTNLQQHSLLLEIDADRLASNVKEIYEANLSFWSQCLQPMLASSRATHEPLDPSLMRSAFVQIRNTFRPYTRYCLEHTACLSYVKEQNRTNEFFKVYLAWCECQKDCERLRLMDLLAKPMQRLTRYSLLLKAILKKTECREQCIALEEMIAHMNKFVLTVDLELRKKDDLERLSSTASRLDYYEMGAGDVHSDEIDKLVKNYCHFELLKPLFNCPLNCHRQLLYDSQHYLKQGFQLGQIRFKDAQVSGKLDVVLLIFTDHLFVCKQSSPNKPWHHNFQHSSSGQCRQTGAAGSPSGGRSPAQRARADKAPLAAQATNGNSLNLSNLIPHQQIGTRFSISSQSSLVHQISAAAESQQNNPAILGLPGARGQHTFAPAAESGLSPDGGTSNQDSQVAGRLGPPPIRGDNVRGGTVRQHRAASGQFLLAQGGPTRTGSVSSTNNKRPAHYASASSLMGAAAREFFTRSADHSRSGDQAGPTQPSQPQADQQSRPPDGQQAKWNPLRVIRSPYPIERLVMHELKDGQSVLCCQLNDSRTIATSFVLYTSSLANNNHLLGGDAANRAAEQRSRRNNHLRAQQDSSRSDSDGTKQRRHQPAGGRNPNGRRASDSRNQPEKPVQLTAAGQLINLIKQAQARYRCAADFHGRQLASFFSAPAAADGGSFGLQRSRLGAGWSSLRGSRFASEPPVSEAPNLVRQLSADCAQDSARNRALEQWMLELEVSPQEQQLEERRASCLTTTGRQQIKQTNLIVKAIIEQHQSMLLNHGHHDWLSQFDYRCQLSADRARLQVSARLNEEATTSEAADTASTITRERAAELLSRQWLLGSPAYAGSQSSVFEELIVVQSNASRESQLPTPTSYSLSSSRKNSMQPVHQQHGGNQLMRPNLSLRAHHSEAHNADKLLSPNRIYTTSGLVSAGHRRISSGGLRLGAVGRGHLSRSARLANQAEVWSDNEALLSCSSTRKADIETRAAELESSLPSSAGRCATQSLVGSPLCSSSSSASTSTGSLSPRPSMKNHLSQRVETGRAEAEVDQASAAHKQIKPPTEKQVTTNESNGVHETQQQQQPRKSGRRTLSSLKRQNVIISASSEHQQGSVDSSQAKHTNKRESSADTCTINSEITTNTTSGPSTSLVSSNGAKPAHHPLDGRRFKACNSQATTMDQTSVTLDDSSAPDWLAGLRLNSDHLSSTTPDNRAMSFELGNLRNLDSVRATDLLLGSLVDSGQHVASEYPATVRSASMETRSPVSVTLTLPNNEQLEDLEGSLAGAENKSRVQDASASSSKAPRVSKKEPALAEPPSGPVYLNIPRKRQMHRATGLERTLIEPPSQARASSPSSLDEPAGRPAWTSETCSYDSDTSEPHQMNRTASGGEVILSKIRRLFRLSLDRSNQTSEPSLNLIERQETAARNQVLPLLNVINASPIYLDKNCDFPDEPKGFADDADHSGRASSDSASCQSSPDWPISREPMIEGQTGSLIRRSSSATKLLNSYPSSTHKLSSSTSRQVPSSGDNCSSLNSSDESVHFLKKCQTLLMFHRRHKRRAKRFDQEKSAHKTVDSDPDGAKREQSDCEKPASSSRAYVEQLSPSATDGSRSDLESGLQLAALLKASSNSNDSQDNLFNNSFSCAAEQAQEVALELERSHRESATGYLGFYEKLDFHNRLVSETTNSYHQGIRLEIDGHLLSDNLAPRDEQRPQIDDGIAFGRGNGSQTDANSNRSGRQKPTLRGLRSSTSSASKFRLKRDPIVANVTNHLKRSLTGETIHSLLRATSLRSIVSDTVGKGSTINQDINQQNR